MEISKQIADNYEIANNTFIGKDTGKVSEERQTIIGDDKQDAFFPQMKLLQWENETNFSARLRHTEDAAIVETDVDKIIWKGEKVEAHFYDLPETKSLPKAFEFEVLLLEKPKTNKVEFTIQSKGLSFFYQPELTQKEKDDGHSRDENAIGSYAVYHSTKKDDFSQMGGKNYKTGKAFHIYRPEIIDNNGKKVWGKLNITDGFLTIEIPQEFLDKAAYPVIVDPTYGFTSPGASWYGASGRCFTGHFTPSFPGGTPTQLHQYFRNNDASNNHVARLGMYDYSGGVPVNLECQTNELMITAGSAGMWVEGNTTTNPALAAGEYALAFLYYVGGMGDVQHNYDSGNLGDWDSDDGLGNTTVLPDPFVADNGGVDYLGAAYVTYTAAGAGAIMNQFQRTNIGADLCNGVFA